MLKTRILTAVVLLAFLLPALLSEWRWPFAALLVVLMAAAGWEWGRLNGLGQRAAVGFGGLLAAACAASFASGTVQGLQAGQGLALAHTMAAAGVLAWVVLGGAALRAGVAAWPQVPRGLRLALGFVLLMLAAWALARSRAQGLAFVLSVFCVVWMADVSAYAGGRAWGRRKLAPLISPGKTWEGVWSALLGVQVMAWIWFALEASGRVPAGSLFGLLQARWGFGLTALMLVFLSALSVLGDLLESLVKRAAGAKDSSSLLPGHGGVLDRIDALLPVFPAALALATLAA
jgi:phosphatidate cytidylyltransferase